MVRAIGSSPQEPYSLIYVTLLSAIYSAETSVRITNAYFVPDAQLLAALQAAAQRGVDVTLILPSQTDSWLAFHAEFGAQVQTMFDKDLAQSQRINLEDWERRGIDLRVKELLARVWAYWL